MIVGHTHRVSNLMRGNILITEGINAGASYSVLQLLLQGGDVAWAGGATRVAKNLGVAPRADVKAIVDDANAQTAVLRNQVIGRSRSTSGATPTRLNESAMGNMVADAMREKYPGVEAAYTNSGGLRQDLLVTPPSAGEQPGEITWGEMFAVLPFGNRTTIFTLTGGSAADGVRQRLLARSATSQVNTGRFPQISGPEGDVPLHRHDARRRRHVEDADRAERDADPDRPDRHRPHRDERLHVHGRRRLHGLRRRRRTSCSPATTCSRSRSTTWRSTRPWRRWSTAA